MKTNDEVVESVEAAINLSAETGREGVMTLPARLAAWRRLRALSQPAAAALLGVPVASLRNWEQGRTRPSPPAERELVRRMEGGAMKALSLIQPWGSAMAAGLKRIETRSWSTPYRGLLAIHASAGAPEFARQSDVWLRGLASYSATMPAWDNLPRGAVLCVVRLVDCKPTEALEWSVSELEFELGDYSPGRYGWVTEPVEVLAPMRAKGRLGLWEWGGRAVTV